MILPATAERTGGFCMPCRPFSSLTAEEREEFNATMKKPLVSFTFSYNAANAALNSGNNVEAIEAYDSAIEEWEKAKKGNDDSIPQEIVAMCLSNRGTALTKQDEQMKHCGVSTAHWKYAPVF